MRDTAFSNEILTKRWPDATRYEIASHDGNLYRFDGTAWQPIERTPSAVAEWKAQQAITRAMETLDEAAQRRVAAAIGRRVTDPVAAAVDASS